MALCKIGTAYINETPYPVYLLQGNATRDGESRPVSGKPHSQVSIAAKTEHDGSTIFVTVNCWRNNAALLTRVHKGDSLLCVGAMKERTYNDKIYYDLDADFVCMNGAGFVGSYSTEYSVPSSVQLTLADEDLDEDLPF